MMVDGLLPEPVRFILRASDGEDGDAMLEERTPLTDAEWKIMTLLWEHSPLTMPQITHALEAETGWTKHTVITLLKRMMQKGTVRMEEAEPARRYYPCVEKDKVAREQTQTLLSRLFEGRASLLVSNMVEQGELTDDEVDELMDIL